MARARIGRGLAFCHGSLRVGLICCPLPAVISFVSGRTFPIRTLLENFLADASLQAIAAENNLSETAFLVPSNGDYRLRWFTATTEVPLCGHATLASATVVMERLEPGRNRVVFHTMSGPLTVRRENTGYVMDFPTRPSQPVSTLFRWSRCRKLGAT